MHKERMLRMADFLEKLPQELFDIRRYASITATRKTLLNSLRDGFSHCGTNACACGWMPAIFPEFCYWGELGDIYVIDDSIGNGIIDDKFTHPIDIAEAILEIDFITAQSLFLSTGPDDRTTPKELAEKIRALVDKAA